MNKKLISLFLFSLLFTMNTAFAAPVANELTKYQTKNAICTFTADEFEDSYTSPNSLPLESIQVTSLPPSTAGTLEVKNVPISENQSVPHDDLSSLTFEPASDFTGEVVFAYKAFDGTEYSNPANVKIIYTDEPLSTAPTAESFNLSVTKNTPEAGKLVYTYTGSETLSFSVVDGPSKGSVEITSTQGDFIYTPHTDEIGNDSFTFRVSAGELASNIATCSVTISEPQTPAPSPEAFEFVYEDTKNHWVNYSAVKMVEKDIIKGERVGSKYYFYPDTVLRRIDVINYLLASLNATVDDVNTDNINIFADSASLPEYINKIGYKAYELGIIEGERVGDEIYLNPYSSVKRVEVVKMIDSAMGPKTRSDKELEFIDASAIPDWAVQHVKNMVGYGILQGYEDNTMRPFSTVTKAQEVEMMYQMIKYNQENTQTLAHRLKSRLFNANGEVA
ncbi:MAG: Ig-like domain-containing protein [Clostridia bacterium]|nr:Ig-like domain-containing protein [Clostridia bacterium]